MEEKKWSFQMLLEMVLSNNRCLLIMEINNKMGNNCRMVKINNIWIRMVNSWILKLLSEWITITIITIKFLLHKNMTCKFLGNKTGFNMTCFRHLRRHPIERMRWLYSHFISKNKNKLWSSSKNNKNKWNRNNGRCKSHLILLHLLNQNNLNIFQEL